MSARALVLSAALGVLVAGLAGPPSARAQGLGDAAAREKQKRGTKPPPEKVYTNQDLKPEKGTSGGQPEAGDSAGAAPAGAATTTAAPAASPAASGGARPGDPVERERHDRSLLEAEWRMRFANAREELANAEAAAWTDAYRIDIVGGQPVQVRTRERIETPELKRARAALAELEEEFRRTGLPAGWARE